MESTRGKILDLLRTKDQTVMSWRCFDLNDNAGRAHLLSLERDGLAHQSGTQPGFRKPHATYALTSEAEQISRSRYGVLLVLFSVSFQNS